MDILQYMRAWLSVYLGRPPREWSDAEVMAAWPLLPRPPVSAAEYFALFSGDENRGAATAAEANAEALEALRRAGAVGQNTAGGPAG